jgi:integrase
VTQDDLLYRFRPRGFAITAEFGTVRAACRAMGIHPWTYYRWTRQLDRHSPEILAQAPAATCRCPRLNGRRCASSPRRDRRLGRGHLCPLPGAVFVGAYSSLRIGGLAGLRPSRVDLLAGAVTVAETFTEVKGKLIAGPPKTRAGRRTVGLPPFVIRELETHLAAAQRPGSHVFTAAGGGRCGSRAFGRALGCRLPRQPACRACVSTDLRDTAVALWIAAGATPKEVAVRGAHLGQLHPGPLWPPDDPPGRSRRAGAIRYGTRL